MKNRRTFVKTGIAAGAGIIALASVAGKSDAAKNYFSKKFKIMGLPASVELSLAKGISDDAELDVSMSNISSKTAAARVRVKRAGSVSINRMFFKVSFPLKDVHRIWFTPQLDGMGQHAFISLPWGQGIPASGHHGSLIAAIQNRYGRNRGFIALKNQTGDATLGFRTDYGGTHDNPRSSMHLSIERKALKGPYPADGLDETLYVSLEDESWFFTTQKFVRWYDSQWALRFNTPEHCFDPVWNSWYPFKNDVNEELFLRGARRCLDLGIKTVEIDSGWFMKSGDWVPDPKKFPDLRGMVKKVHDMGLKVTAWYSSLHIDTGADAIKEMGKYRLVFDGKVKNQLCARVKKVQERAGRIAEELMSKYDLDGLKVDFLDASMAAAPLVLCEGKHKHDTAFVSNGVRETMRLIAEGIRKVKPDALIEYRINYCNVANRPFANCYRGQDAPSDPDLIRRHLTLIRSWCSGVAPHADYAYWSPDDSDENVARFMATLVFYSVPTLSIDFDVLPDSHISIIKAWLNFYRKHRDTMWKSDFEPLSDDVHFSVVRLSGNDHSFIPCFLREWPASLPVPRESSGNIYIFNGSARQRIFTKLEGIDGWYTINVLDRMLQQKSSPEKISGNNKSLVLDLPVPVGGMVHLSKK